MTIAGLSSLPASLATLSEGGVALFIHLAAGLAALLMFAWCVRRLSQELSAAVCRALVAAEIAPWLAGDA